MQEQMTNGNQSSAMSKSIKILVIPSWYPPDGGYFFKEHSEALAMAGCTVDVLVNRIIGIRKIGLVGKKNWHRFNINTENGLKVIRSNYWKIPGNENLNIRLWVRRTVRLFRRYVRNFGLPDLILTHSALWAGLAAARIFKESNVPYIITEHRSFFVWENEDARKMVKSFYIPHLQEAYSICKNLIIVSDSMKSGLLELFPELEQKIQVIPNMINGNYFCLPEKIRKYDPFVFLSAGRLAAVKGLDILIDAFGELVKKTDRKVHLRIAGRGESREQLEKQVQYGNLSDRVTFLGRVSRDQMVQEMQGANCFVLASTYEAFGVVLIEAMSTGLPVIATRSGGPESILDESCGYMIETGNIEELTGAMLKMIMEFDRFNQQYIRERTLQYYGSQIIAQKYLEVFEEVQKHFIS
jgi:glycosyltransferase involved in cell wall biosynthesis